MLSCISQSLPFVGASRVLNQFSDPLSYSFRTSQKILWSYRAFIEAKSAYARGDYVLFDTLTYSNYALSYFHDYEPSAFNTCWDFPCFSRLDLQLFFKRLRKKIYSEYHIGSDAFRYIVTCEYGAVEKTFRPHYHLLFFVDHRIDPIRFSIFINQSWWQGRTDGKPYKSTEYLLSKRVFRSVTSDSLNIVNYVVKYITKQFYCYKKLYKRAFMCLSIIDPGFTESYSGRLRFRRLKNHCLPFHLQSLHFGENYEIHESKESVIDRDSFCFVNNGKYLFVPITGYYRRKLFFHTSFRNGRLVWVPNDNYLPYLLNNYQRRKENLVLKYREFFGDSVNTEALADYSLLYRGVFAHPAMLTLSPTEFLMELYNPLKYTLKEEVCGTHLYIHGSFKDRCIFSGNFVSNYYISPYISFNYSKIFNNSDTCFVPRLPLSVPSSGRLLSSKSNHKLASKTYYKPRCLTLSQFLKNGYDDRIVFQNEKFEQLLMDYDLEQKRRDETLCLKMSQNEYIRQSHRAAAAGM